jgi:hypothetical protein
MAISFKGAHFPQEIILIGVRWDTLLKIAKRFSSAVVIASS